MLITDRHRSGPALLPILDTVVNEGIDILQIRENDLAQNELIEFGRDIVTLVDGRSAIVINSNVAAAISLGVGLHLPESQTPLDPREFERLAPGALIGRSFHGSLPSATERLDYLIFGHVFSTSSKPGLPPRGLEHLSTVVSTSRLPIWAVGGISADNAASVIQAGSAGIAVIGAILDAADPGQEVRRLRKAMDAARDESYSRQGQQSMDQSTTCVVSLNGKETTFAAGTTVDEFLATRSLLGKLVVVEINGTIVPRSDFPTRIIDSGDQVEVVHFVGGG